MRSGRYKRKGVGNKDQPNNPRPKNQATSEYAGKQ